MQLWRSLSRSRASYLLRNLCALLAISVVFGIPASQAQSVMTVTSLLLPSGIAYDTAGNLFIADARKNQIFEVSLSGVTTIVAGTGEQGFAGDSGLATLALLNGPTSLAVAANGTLYIADTGNQRIRSVTGGQIQTVAGTGVKGFSGDGVDARLAMLNTPLALAIDGSGDLLIADSGNHRLRRLSANVLSTVVGNGVQGFAGDGASALLAQMDTPAGVAVGSDGRIYVADSHNHRIRVITTDGTIATLAGSGVRGFSGDGAAATGASLFLPRGVAVTPAGGVIFADSDNQRLRLVDAHGIITTVAGNGVQGSSAAGAIATTASLDSPRGIAFSTFAALVFADAHNHVVQEIAADADLYPLLGSASSPVTVALSVPSGLTYGQGAIGVTVSGSAPPAQGNVALLDGANIVTSATLSNATVTLPAGMLSAGQHTLTAAFAGDGLHPATTSTPALVSISPAMATATAQSVTVVYGDPTTSLAGTVAGILPRDLSNAIATFALNAPDLSPVGTYPIIASLSGSASTNYTLMLAPTSGSMQIVQAVAQVTMVTPQVSYAGLPVTMTASASAVTRGSPTGSINFIDNGSVVASGTIVGGVATAVYLNPGEGPHSISASYSGDHNFLPVASSAVPVIVSAMPDFAVAFTGNTTQTVQSGATATYTLQITSQSAPFSGAVSMSASGLPPGATASFSPVAVVPGSSPVVVNLSIQTTALARRQVPTEMRLGALLILGLCIPWGRRRRPALRAVLIAFLTIGICSSVGCGDRAFPATSKSSQSFPITVTATSTNLAGAIVVHTASIVLVVQ